MSDIKFEQRKTIEQVEESNELAPKFDKDRLIPVVTTDFNSGEVLMQGYMMFDPIHGCEKRVAGSIFDPIEDGSPFKSRNADDGFVGSLRNANPVTNGGVVENNSVICNMCKQDVSSFVGLVSCVCSMGREMHSSSSGADFF